MIMTLLASALLAQCGHAGYGAAYGYGYQAPAYHAPVYHATAYFVADPQYYAGVVAGYIRQQSAEALKLQVQQASDAKLDRIAGVLERIEARAAAASQQQQQQQQQQQPGPGFRPEPAPTPAPAPPPLITAPPGNSLAAILTRNRCIQCHTGDGASGDVVLFDAPDRLTTLGIGEKQRIYAAVKSGRMPKNGEKVSDADRAALLADLKAEIARVASTLD